MARRPLRQRSISGHRLIGGVIAATALSLAVVASAWRDDSNLGAPRLWPWLLTGLQVLALWSAGQRRWWGWLLGGSVQLPWIAYALVTDQLGFIPGCAVSASVQIHSYLGNTSQRKPISTPQQRPKEATT